MLFFRVHLCYELFAGWHPSSLQSYQSVWSPIETRALDDGLQKHNNTIPG